MTENDNTSPSGSDPVNAIANDVFAGVTLDWGFATGRRLRATTWMVTSAFAEFACPSLARKLNESEPT